MYIYRKYYKRKQLNTENINS